MPLPKPKPDEKREDFLSRCISDDTVQGDSESNEQATAICHTQWTNRERNMSINNRLLKAIRARQQKQTEFAYGIITADVYARTLLNDIGSDDCYKLVSKQTSFDDILQKAAKTLVYSNASMEIEEKGNRVGNSVELPKNTLMAFRHILTTTRKDRDGDILRSSGAELDPKMLLLWQHVHTLPIGKMITEAKRDDDKVSVVSVIVDMNELSHDAAVLVDNDMARFSHGFRALEFEEISEKDDKENKPSGFDIKRFEVMEESLVSVPANVDAQNEEVLLSLVEGGKLTSALMKACGQSIRQKRDVSVPGITIKYSERVGNYNRELSCTSLSDLKAAADAGLIGEKKDENQSGDGSEKGEQGKDSLPPEKANGNDKEKSEEESSLPKVKAMVGETGETDEHMHTATVDEKGNGSTSSDDGHSHGIKGFLIQPGGDNEHKHTLDRDSLEKKELEKGKTKAYPGDLKDSWEWISDKLRSESKSYLISKGIEVGEHDWTYVIGTYPNHAVLVLERCDTLSTNQKRFFEIGWKMENKEPKFTGDPKQIDVVTKTEVFERAFGYSNKAGRVISKANETKLREVAANISEVMKMEISRSAKNTLREASRDLSSVLSSLGDELQSDQQIDEVKQAIAIVLSSATKEDRQELTKYLKAMEEINKQDTKTSQYQNLVSGN